MPNYAINYVGIEGNVETIKSLYENAKQEDGKFHLLNTMVPRPESENENWDDWNLENWGTKWDILDPNLEYSDKGDGTAKITGYFLTAWSDPVDAYKTFSEQNADVKIISAAMDLSMGWMSCSANGNSDSIYQEYEVSSREDIESVPQFIQEVFKEDIEEFLSSMCFEDEDEDVEDIEEFLSSMGY